MKPDKNIDEILKQHLPSASKEEMEWDAARVLHQLRARKHEPVRESIASRDMSAVFAWRRVAFITAAAAVVVAITVGTITLRQQNSTFEAVVKVDEREPKPEITRVGQSLAVGETVRTNGGGVMLMLPDGSRVEVRSQSELSLERAEDGLRIRLSSGGVIVSAAEQRMGHLYVQTRDMTVSVVGTVFLVDAEEQGSRVAVIEGEVQVQQGDTSKTLRPGQQVATNPTRPIVPVIEELAWSRNAPAHLALLEQSLAHLQQSAFLAPVSPAPNSPAPQEAFEVTSIRPNTGAAGGGRGGAQGARGGGPAGPTACGGMVQVNPGRFVATNVTLYRLVTLAYGRHCRLSTEQDLISGGPDWLRSVAFDIQATLPAGSPSYTLRELSAGETPVLQRMIQNLLSDRFKLALRRSTKDVPVYNLTIVKTGRVKLSDDQTVPAPFVPPPAPTPRDPNAPPPRGLFGVGVDPPNGKVTIWANSISMSQLINNMLQGGVGRMVVDKTEPSGLYDIPQVTVDVGPFSIEPGAVTVWPEIMLQLGMKMEPARGPAEVLIIDHAEKPAEN